MNLYKFSPFFSLLLALSCQQTSVLDSQDKTHLVLQANTSLFVDGFILPAYDWKQPFSPVCESGDFCWRDPQPLVSMDLRSAQIKASLAFPDGTVWLAGSQGIILKKQGNLWKQIASPTTQYLSGLVGTDPNEVWMTFSQASSQGVVHCQNETCTQTPLDQPGNQHLVQTDTQDLWFYGEGFGGKVYHFSSTNNQFVLMDGLIQAKLTMAQKPYRVVAVWGKSKTDVTILISPAKDSMDGDGSLLALKWDGTQFGTPIASLPTNSLFLASMMASSKQEIWLRGFDSTQQNHTFTVYHSLDGTNWTEITGPSLQIWSELDLIHFYDNTFWATTSLGTKLYRYNINSSSWDLLLDRLPSDRWSEFWILQNRLFILSSTNIDELGLYQSQPGPTYSSYLVWTTKRSGNAIQKMWNFSSEERWFWIKDNQAKNHLVHQQGTQNQSFTLPEDILAGFPLQTNEFWFGGKNTIYRFQGNLLSTFSPQSDQEQEKIGFTITSIWGNSPSNLWATSNNGHVFHFDGEVWSLVAKSQVPLFSSFGIDSNQVWLGGKGILLHFDDTKFESIPLPTDKQVVSWIWGTQANDLWFADSTTLLHLSKGHFESFAFPVPTLSSLSFGSSGEIWIIAQNKVFQQSGSTWKQVLDLSGTLSDMWQIHAMNQNDIWLFSPYGGYVLRKQK